MLAKQGWKLVNNVDALVNRVLKAKNYANTDFMNAQLGSNPSYTWRSILEGRVVLEKGLIWRAGNGQTINIRDFPWIPNAPNFRAQMRVNADKGIN